MMKLLDSKLLTAEEYGRLPDDGRYTELVRGRIVELNHPPTSHGYLLSQMAYLLMQFVEPRRKGRIVGAAGLITQRDPDTVRGPDVAFYSFQRIPAGPCPAGYWPESPELVIEIRSESERWKDILQKTAEYLTANVLTVAVVDPTRRQVHLFSDKETTVLSDSDLLTLPEVLPGFEVAVARLFE